MKLIPLTQGLHAMVDDEDFDELNRWRWCASRIGKTRYARRSLRLEGPRDPVKRDHPYASHSMHTQLTGFAEVDHIDGNGLNNQRANLRPATGPENNRNQGLRRDNTSGRKGVYRNSAEGLWRAQIKAANRRLSLGRFDDLDEAARAYDTAARKLHGPYAALNFPGPGERSALTGEVVPS